MSPSLRERLSSATETIRSRVGSDVRTAERAASGRAQKLRERARNVDSAAMRQQLRQAADQLDSGDMGPPGGRSQRDTMAAAEEASTMAPPVNASLRPTTSPEDIDSWVTGAGRSDPGRETGALGFEIGEFGSPQGRDGPAMDDLVTSGGETPAADETMMVSGFDVSVGQGSGEEGEFMSTGFGLGEGIDSSADDDLAFPGEGGDGLL